MLNGQGRSFYSPNSLPMVSDADYTTAGNDNDASRISRYDHQTNQNTNSNMQFIDTDISYVATYNYSTPTTQSNSQVYGWPVGDGSPTGSQFSPVQPVTQPIITADLSYTFETETSPNMSPFSPTINPAHIWTDFGHSPPGSPMMMDSNYQPMFTTAMMHHGQHAASSAYQISGASAFVGVNSPRIPPSGPSVGAARARRANYQPSAERQRQILRSKDPRFLDVIKYITKAMGSVPVSSDGIFDPAIKAEVQRNLHAYLRKISDPELAQWISQIRYEVGTAAGKEISFGKRKPVPDPGARLFLCLFCDQTLTAKNNLASKSSSPDLVPITRNRH
ncbi:hypothetical protein CVT24_004222 [Panaeolus cyanescens]|uniref:Uncharacterized protein n=1 Tax=Panaeolus cyanescens TaxID=181874 RepID=A0A409YSY3_9AGAR|nr:hypothetical protein CVT24_004222 [Panaeolus cyanescens]